MKGRIGSEGQEFKKIIDFPTHDQNCPECFVALKKVDFFVG